MNARTPEALMIHLDTVERLGLDCCMSTTTGIDHRRAGCRFRDSRARNGAAFSMGQAGRNTLDRDSALRDEAGFLSPSDEGEVRRSKQKMYFQPAPVYSPDIIDEEVQRILMELDLPTSRPRPMPPAMVDSAPETDPIAAAIAEYYRDQAA